MTLAINDILSNVSLGETEETPTPAVKQAFDLSALGKPKTTTTKKKGKEYPRVPDPDGTLAEAEPVFIERKEQLAAIKGSIEAMTGEFKEAAVPFYYELFNGKNAIESSVQIGEKILLSFQKRYNGTPALADVEKLIGPDKTARLFQSGFQIKIDGFQIPDEFAQAIIERIGAVFAEMNCADAITATAVVRPTPEFHTERHRLLDTETNKKLHELVPMTVAIKVKK